MSLSKAADSWGPPRSPRPCPQWPQPSCLWLRLPCSAQEVRSSWSLPLRSSELGDIHRNCLQVGHRRGRAFSFRLCLLTSAIMSDRSHLGHGVTQAVSFKPVL